MRRIMINVGEPVTLEDVEQVIRKVDTDGDGQINYEEFTKVHACNQLYRYRMWPSRSPRPNRPSPPQVIIEEKASQYGSGSETPLK